MKYGVGNMCTFVLSFTISIAAVGINCVEHRVCQVVDNC